MVDRSVSGGSQRRPQSIFVVALCVASSLLFVMPLSVLGAPANGGRDGEPTITTQWVNISDPNSAKLLLDFNLTGHDIEKMNATLNSGHSRDSNPNASSDERNEDDQREDILLSAIKNHTRNRNAPNEDDTATNAISFYPRCTRNMDTTNWTINNTANLYFAVTIFNKLETNTRLHSAILRLYQLPQNTSNATGGDCGEPDDLIVVNVSVMIKHKHINGDIRYKKHLCESRTFPAAGGQWVELDVRQVVRHWLKAVRMNASVAPNRSEPYLTIDVRDQNDNVLKTSNIFQSCTQACNSVAIPWSVYHPASEGVGVPTVPRLDLMYSYAQPATHEPASTRSHRLYSSYVSRFQRLSQLESQRQGHSSEPNGMQEDAPASNPGSSSSMDYPVVGSSSDETSSRGRHHRRRNHHRHHNNGHPSNKHATIDATPTTAAE